MRARAGALQPSATVPTLADISDRAARILGTLAFAGVAIDPRAIRALTAADVVTANQGTPNIGPNAWVVQFVRPNGNALDIVSLGPSLLNVNGTAAVNTQLTLTLPAVAGQFHYITSLEWWKLYSVIGVAAGAGVIITSTNLPGNPAWTTEQLASPAGTVVQVIRYTPVTPLRSLVVNTATTIVAPLQLQTIWRGNVSYFAAT